MENWIEFDGKNTVIQLDKLFKVLLKRWYLIVLTTALFGAALFAYSSFLITPLYQSSVRMYVNNKSSNSDTVNISSSDVSASKNLVDTYSVILKNHEIIEGVIEKTGVSYTYEELVDMISTSSVNNTEVFQVTVTSADAEEAAEIANAIAEVAPEPFMEIVSGSSVKIVDEARVATEKSSPNVKRYAAMGAAIGFILSCGAILLSSALKNGLSVEDKIRNDFSDKPILASIPEMLSKKSKKENDPTTLLGNLNFAAAESYKLLRTNLSFCFTDSGKSRVIGMTSSGKGEGKSTAAVNLAYTLAQAGNKVCIIDCDLRLPTVYKKMKVKKKPGLVNLLVGQISGNQALQKYTNGGTTVYVITSGDVPPNPTELLGSPRMKSVLESLRKTFDYVILDLPPVGVVSDALTVTKLVDGMVLAVREDFYERRILNESLRMMEAAEANVLGLLVTHSTAQQKEYKKGYGYSGGYGYGYGYGSTDTSNAEQFDIMLARNGKEITEDDL